MEVLYTVVLGAALILFFCFFKFPYFLQDCRFMRKMLVVRSKRMKFREKTPFYSVLDCFLDVVKKQPHKPFILYEDQVHTYLQVDQASNKVAQALQLHAGSTVALLLENGPVLVWMWLGLFKLGCPVSMLNTNIRTKSLLHCFRCCGASVLIAGAGIVSFRPTQDGAKKYLPLTVVVLFLHFCQTYRLYVVCVFVCVCAGITVVLRRKFSVSQFWKDCRKYDVTAFQYIGEVMRYLCNTPKMGEAMNHKVRLAIGNGLRADVWQEFQRRFGSVDIQEFYAASDGILSFINYVGKVGAVGRVNFYQKVSSFYLMLVTVFTYWVFPPTSHSPSYCANDLGTCGNFSKEKASYL
uniref:Long-chain-fatty-acid--CoA ligase n=1 Tax=Astyanax mexicanus TaxID=7994 RepID=A0A8B9GS09_ASTMX